MVNEATETVFFLINEKFVSNESDDGSNRIWSTDKIWWESWPPIH